MCCYHFVSEPSQVPLQEYHHVSSCSNVYIIIQPFYYRNQSAFLRMKDFRANSTPENVVNAEHLNYKDIKTTQPSKSISMRIIFISVFKFMFVAKQ